MPEATTPRPKPSTALSLAIFLLATSAMAVSRLHFFHDRFIALTYGLPLLVCLWHRDLRLLWSMAAAFVSMSAVKAFWILPNANPSDGVRLVEWLMQVTNILVVAYAVHAIASLTLRLHAHNAQLLEAHARISAQNDELQSQSEELAQQNEELQRQSEEMTQQNEELERQSAELEQQGEELETQAEELRATNEELNQREAILAALLTSLRDVEDEREGMQRICEALLPMLAGAASAAAVVEQADDLLVVRAYTNMETLALESWPVAQSFARIVMEQGQTAFIDDLSARPDLIIPSAKRQSFRSILATPLRVDGRAIGAVEAYAEQPRRWTREHFRIIEWVAGQCSVLLELLRAHLAVRVSEQRYGSFVRASAQVVWTTDARGQVVMDIPAWQALTGQTARQAAGFGWMDAIREQDRPRVADAWRRASESKGIYEVEYLLRIHDGSWRDILARGVPVLEPDGSVREYIGTCIDITERRQAERQLRELNTALEQRVAERTAEVHLRASQLQRLAGELTRAEQKERQHLATVLHDGLQQLLVGAKFHLDILRKQTETPGLSHGIDRVDRLLDESLATSRSLTVELSPPILYEGTFVQVLHWLARWAEDKHGLRVQVQADERVDPRTERIRLLLFQATRELLLNARKHAGVDHARVSLSRRDGHVQIVVADDGAGFAPDQVHEARSDSVGPQTGLGLFSIRERAEFLGGRLEMDSQPGQGARIRLLLPCETAQALEDASEDAVERGRQGPGERPAGPDTASPRSGHPQIRVLLADDHAVVRDGLVRLFQAEQDIQVVGQAEDGQQAVEMAVRLRPDVVLMDVSMPKLGGIEATRRVTQELPTTKIIGLSMHAQEDVAAEMLAAGAVKYLTKTSQPPVLLAAIRECKPRQVN